MLQRWGFKMGVGLFVLWVLALSTVAAGCRQLLGLDEKYGLIGDVGAGGTGSGGDVGAGGSPTTTSATESTSGTGGGPTSSSSTGSGMSICGDGVTSPPEECDDANTTDSDGCDACKFSCVTGDPTRDCAPTAVCVDKGACNDSTHICSASLPLPAGTPCGPAQNTSCQGGVCTVAVCGNGLREPTEQCDDANTTNLDGCDSACKFEQNLRVNYLEILFGTDAFCTANRLGGAITSTIAQTTFQGTFTEGVANGTIDTFFKVLGLEDLTGATNDASIVIGGMNGAPVGTLPANGLDRWHTVDPTSIDGNRNPTAILPGYISGGILYAGPGSIAFAGFKVSTEKFVISIGPSLAPLASTGSPPGHLGSEHLDPALVSFASTGQPNSAGAGKLCGDVIANSIAAQPIPSQFTGTACTQAYTATNTLLDVLVVGCTNMFLGTFVQATQPDRWDTTAPPAGAGMPYTLTANAQKTVSTCKDITGATVTLSTCLNAAAYSSAFKFATQRVIVK